MTLTPLLQASAAIQIHAVAALAAFGLGAVQLVGAKGTGLHRTLGWAWVVAMAATAAVTGSNVRIELPKTPATPATMGGW